MIASYKQIQSIYRLIKKMGQTSFELRCVKSSGLTLKEIKQGEGYKVLQEKTSLEQYLLLRKVLIQKEGQIERQLEERAKVKGKHIPELVQFDKEYPHYCSEAAVLHVLFRKPSKSLKQQIQNRISIHQWFDEGEIMMIVYCSLSALLEFKVARLSDNLHINKQTLFVSNKGGVVVSDINRYCDLQRFHCSSISSSCHDKENKTSGELRNLIELGHLVEQMNINNTFSPSFKQFANKMKRGDIHTCEQALKKLYEIKMAQKCGENTHSFKVNDSNKSNKINQLYVCRSSSTGNKREPLGEIKLVCQQNDKLKEKHDCHDKKQHQISNIDQNKDPFHDQNLGFQDVGTRLDDFSSITEVETSKQSEEVSVDKSQSSIQIENPMTIPSMEVIFPRRPQRLRQLILNQKQIIYEESDQLSSIPSHRTAVLHNIYSP